MLLDGVMAECLAGCLATVISDDAYRRKGSQHIEWSSTATPTFPLSFTGTSPGQSPKPVPFVNVNLGNHSMTPVWLSAGCEPEKIDATTGFKTSLADGVCRGVTSGDGGVSLTITRGDDDIPKQFGIGVRVKSMDTDDWGTLLGRIGTIVDFNPEYGYHVAWDNGGDDNTTLFVLAPQNYVMVHQCCRSEDCLQKLEALLHLELFPSESYCSTEHARKCTAPVVAGRNPETHNFSPKLSPENCLQK